MIIVVFVNPIYIHAEEQNSINHDLYDERHTHSRLYGTSRVWVALDCAGVPNKVNTECISTTIQWIAVCHKYSGSPEDELNRRDRLTFHCVTPAGQMIQ